MIDNYKHIINKVFVEVNTNSKEKAYYFKDNIDMFIKEHVLPRLMTSFDDLGGENPDHFVQLERLDIELSIKPKQDLKGLDENIVNQILKKIKKLKEENPYKTNKEDALKLVKSDERQFEKFIHFLENGVNSWFDISEEIINFNENRWIFQDKKRITKLAAILKNLLPRKRLISQFFDEEIQEIFNHFITYNQFKKETSLRPGMIKEIILKGNVDGKKFTLKERFLIWDITFISLIRGAGFFEIPNKLTQLVLITKGWNTSKEEAYIKAYFLERLKTVSALMIIQNLQQEIKKVSRTLDMYQDTITQSKQQESPDTLNFNDFNSENPEDIHRGTSNGHDISNISRDLKDIYIHNAGLILVHPFLGQLFKNCGVIDEQNQFLDKEIAVHVLHYIATGKEEQLENKMVLEKFLCNLPSKYPINRFVPLENKVKNHVDEMLTSLIEHWEVMKNSSKDLLRNEFLKRPGKLILTEDRPRLILERKTQDILLDKIPWNISMIKLPWKNKIIFVDW